MLKEISIAERRFKGTRFEGIAESALELHNKGEEEAAKQRLGSLPSMDQLLSQLLKKLEGKSVHTTLTKIARGSVKSEWQTLKGTFSLGTHVAIECEHGNTEYKPLLFDVYEKLGKLLYAM